jgi:hypothetical protein
MCQNCHNELDDDEWESDYLSDASEGEAVAPKENGKSSKSLPVPAGVNSNECPALPSYRPKGYPHIVGIDGFREDTNISNLTFADGIATFLWSWNKEQFEKFFDMSNYHFDIHYSAPDGLIKDMVITRMGHSISVGAAPRDNISTLTTFRLATGSRSSIWRGIRSLCTPLRRTAGGL